MRTLGRIAPLLLLLPLAFGEEAPPVEATFTDAGGKAVKLSDFRGKKAVVLLFMRGSDPRFACHFCSLQTKAYKAAYEELKKLGAEVVVVLPGADDVPTYLRNVGTDEEKDSDPDFQVPYPVLLDMDFSACKVFDVPFEIGGQPFPVSQPATVVVGKDGRILYAYHGKNPPDRPSLEDVRTLLKGGRVEGPKLEQAPAKPSATLAWVPYEEGLKAAKAQKKPVLLEFYGDW